MLVERFYHEQKIEQKMEILTTDKNGKGRNSEKLRERERERERGAKGC